jgi:hypothetical protein
MSDPIRSPKTQVEPKNYQKRRDGRKPCRVLMMAIVEPDEPKAGSAHGKAHQASQYLVIGLNAPPEYGIRPSLS